MDKQEEVAEEIVEEVVAEAEEADEAVEAAEAVEEPAPAQEPKADALDFNVIFGNGKHEATMGSTIAYIVGAFIVIGILMYAVNNDMVVVALAAAITIFFFGKLFYHVRGMK